MKALKALRGAVCFPPGGACPEPAEGGIEGGEGRAWTGLAPGGAHSSIEKVDVRRVLPLSVSVVPSARLVLFPLAGV
jgi:hypothetical protein